MIHRSGGALAPSDELPVPADLAGLLHTRLNALSESARQVARAVAALADPTVVVVESAIGESDLLATVDIALQDAVTGLRGFGYSWADIAARLGVTRQAVQMRWGQRI